MTFAEEVDGRNETNANKQPSSSNESAQRRRCEPAAAALQRAAAVASREKREPSDDLPSSVLARIMHTIPDAHAERTGEKAFRKDSSSLHN